MASAARLIPLILLATALSPGIDWWARVLAGLAFAGVTALLARIVAVAIVAWPDRLVIRNFRNTHTIAWTEIADMFETPPPSPSVYLDNPLYTQDTELLIRLREGSIISATIYSSRMFRYNDHDRRRTTISQLTNLQKQLSPTHPGQTIPGSGPDQPA